MTIVEFMGYAASVFVAISLLMSNIKLLRYINAIGCLLFVIYGLKIGALPIALMNAFCILINIYHLWKIYTTKDTTEKVSLDSATN